MSIVDIKTEQDFTDKVLNATKPVLVDFWAAFPTYTMVEPDLKKVAASYEGKAVVAKLNVDELPGIAACFDLVSIPSVITFKNGREVCRVMGFRTVTDMEKALDKAIGA